MAALRQIAPKKNNFGNPISVVGMERAKSSDVCGAVAIQYAGERTSHKNVANGCV